jgi:glycosyltransferase involved in cell wall biosynthesis
MAEITTVIPVYNGEQFIVETLQSLARQTLKPDRIVIADDCSTDSTEEIVRHFPGLQCEWAPNERNLGLFPNHNNALRFAAETKFFHILHANDLISPTFFEKLIPLIQNTPQFAMAFAGHVFIQQGGEETSQKRRPPGIKPGQLSLKEFLGSQIELKALQLHSTVFKTEYQAFPVQFRTDLPQLSDIVFHAQAAAHCSQIWQYPEILSQVRIHGNSATGKNIQSLDAWVVDEWRAMNMVYDIMRERRFGSFSRKEKMKLLFAARCHVKVQMVRGSNPKYAREIREKAKSIVGSARWLLAGVIVFIRDAFFPKEQVRSPRMQSEKSA